VVSSQALLTKQIAPKTRLRQPRRICSALLAADPISLGQTPELFKQLQ
jgi:hypothetical protein